MRLAIAQLQAFTGNIEQNVALHLDLAQLAVVGNARFIVFPELSLTGYEPAMAKQLATGPNDERFGALQDFSDHHEITMAVGLPFRRKQGIQIGMALFRPNLEPLTYAKQHLHTDEMPYFIPGEGQLLYPIHDDRITPAICYESLLPEHAGVAHRLGSTVYLASVAKPENGVTYAYEHYPVIAKKYGMHVIMANSVGPSDNFTCAGRSAVWSRGGNLLAQMNNSDQGVLIADMDSKISYVLLHSVAPPAVKYQDNMEHLVSLFESRMLPKAAWTHNAHLAVGFSYARRYKAEEAMLRLRTDIQAYNESTDTPNTDTDGYHDTITWFWLHVIRNFCSGKKLRINELFALFLLTDLAKQEYIFRYYSRDLLFSVKARKSIVLPDLQPLCRE